MVNGAVFKNKKIIIPIIVLTIPIWLPIITYLFETIINAGKIVGTNIRIINNSQICIK